MKNLILVALAVLSLGIGVANAAGQSSDQERNQQTNTILDGQGG